jgi:hypothetical protein
MNEGSGRGIFEALFPYLPGGTEENHIRRIAIRQFLFTMRAYRENGCKAPRTLNFCTGLSD